MAAKYNIDDVNMAIEGQFAEIQENVKTALRLIQNINREANGKDYIYHEYDAMEFRSMLRELLADLLNMSEKEFYAECISR